MSDIKAWPFPDLQHCITSVKLNTRFNLIWAIGRERIYNLVNKALIPHTLLQNLFDKLGLGLVEIDGQAVGPL